MRKKKSQKCHQKPHWRFKRTENFEVIGPVVLSTQLHEEMHWRFPIACNRDYSASRALTFVALCRFHSNLIATKYLVRLNHILVSLEIFSGMIFFSWISCYSNFKLLHSFRKCAKRMEISGCKMHWTCSVGHILVHTWARFIAHYLQCSYILKSKRISNDQELIQSEPMSVGVTVYCRSTMNCYLDETNFKGSLFLIYPRSSP